MQGLQAVVASQFYVVLKTQICAGFPCPLPTCHLPTPRPLCSILFDMTMCLCCHFWDSPKMFSINWGKFSHYFLLPSSPREFWSSPGLFLLSLCVPYCHGSHTHKKKLFLGVTERCAQRFSLWIEEWFSSLCFLLVLGDPCARIIRPL